MGQESENPFAREYHGQTTLHPLGLAAVLVLGGLMLILPRRYAVWPMIALACFVPPAQRVVIATLDFNLLRLMVVFGWCRILTRGEFVFAWKPLDWLLLIATAYRTLAGVLLYRSFGALISQLGLAFDILGMYFLFRALVRDWDDVRSLLRGFLWVSVPVTLAFIVEYATARNIFSIFGGVPATTGIRDGRLRCQGAFAHPILAGCFWAAILPLFVSEWWSGASGKSRALLGIATSGCIILACSSSTPVMGVAAVGIGWAAFYCRAWLRTIRWAVFATLVALHLIMVAPVWHLITRITIVGGSTGYHRYALINGAIIHLDEWWLIGSNKGTAHWGYHLFDVTNYYIVHGLHGGIPLLAMFIGSIALGFRGVGRITRATQDRSRLMLAWGLGVAVLVHTFSFLGVTYFGQIVMIWYLTLATITGLEVHVARSAGTDGNRRPAPAADRARRRRLSNTVGGVPGAAGGGIPVGQVGLVGGEQQ